MMKRILQLALLLLAPTLAFGQAATVNWTNVHQEIDGLGGIDRNDLTSGQQSFVFGTGAGQLGISVLHTNVSGDPQDCTSIGTGCATVTSNMTAVLANGGKVWVDGTTPPSRYLESYTIPGCGTAGTRVIPGDFGAWATWITNYVKSLQAQWVNVYGVSVQNEPNTCGFTYYSAADFDTFIKTNLGPTFAANSISALIYFPETSGYGPSGSDGLSTFGSTCMGDSACTTYVGGIAFHDYDLTMSGFSVSAAPYPFGTQGGIKYWETEFGMFQCPPGYQTFCQPGWNVDMTIDGLQWAAILDQRLAVDGLNNWQIYLLQTYDNVDDGLINGNTGAIAKRAYVFGQYGFVRPGYYRIDATHAPQSNVTVSAYQNTGTNTLVIIATNYSGSSINQTFNVTNAPTFTSVTPTQTSTSNSLATLSSVSLSGNSFTYSLPAQSVTTFVGNSSASYTLSTATTGLGTGSISGCAGSYSSGAGYSCTVTPSGGSTIASVTGCGGSGTTTYAGTMPASSCTVTATFNSGGSQLWTGLLNTNRAPNNVWTSAGAGIIPARTTICQTLGTAGQASTYAQTVTYLNIMNALISCAGTNQTVLLNPGTYTMTSTLGNYLSGPGYVALPSNVTLRGSGANQTILAWPSSASFNTCLGVGNTMFCGFNGDNGAGVFADNILQVTAGTAQGSTSITVGTPASAGCYNNAACSGSLSNLHVGSLMQINQCDTNLSTVSCTGTNADNGNLWLCGIGPNGSTATCTWGGADNSFPNRGTNQTVLVTGITGSTVTFTPALIHPDWSQTQSPFVVFSNYPPVVGFGLENLELNAQQLGDEQTMYQCEWCYQSWVKNVAFVGPDVSGGGAAPRKHATFSTGLNNTFRDSYMYGSSPSSEGYGVDFSWGETKSLAENNIAHHIATAYIMENAVGSVFGYNFAADNYYTGGGGAPNWQQCDWIMHDVGDAFDLLEGHEGTCITYDDDHGTDEPMTAFRSYLSGRDPATTCPSTNPSCGTATKIQHTFALEDNVAARYNNMVLSVLGTSTYDTYYQNQGASGSPNSCPSYPATSVYSLNFASGNQIPFSPTCTGTAYTIDNDPLVSSTLMRWGNYDTVNGAVRTNSGETASGAPVYPGLASPSTSYASYPTFYLSGKPAFLNSLPWPGIGPDITAGNISGVSGHANHNAAGTCFYGPLGGVNTGASGPLPFDAYKACGYGTGGGTPQAAAPTFNQANPYSGPAVSVVASTSSSGCGGYIYFGTTNLPTVNTSTYSFTTTVTLYAYVHGCPGFTDSTVSTWVGTLATGTLTAPTFSPAGSVDSVTAPYFLPASFPLAVTPAIPAGTGCYRLDGTAPTAPTAGTCGSGSTTYTSGAISVAANQTLKMLATEVGSTNSSVTASTYNQRNLVLESSCSFNGGNTSITTGTCTLSPNPSAGDGITCGGVIGSNVPTMTFTDNVSPGSYTVANPLYYGTATFAASERVYRSNEAGGSTTITMTLSSAAQYSGFACEAYKPSSGSCPFTLDTAFTQASPYPNATTGATANPSIASNTPTNANELIYGSLVTYQNVPTAGSGFTLVDTLPGGPNLWPEYQIQAAATATTLPYVLAADQWQLQPAGFYCASSGPPPSIVQGAVLQGVTIQ